MANAHITYVKITYCQSSFSVAEKGASIPGLVRHIERLHVGRYGVERKKGKLIGIVTVHERQHDIAGMKLTASGLYQGVIVAGAVGVVGGGAVGIVVGRGHGLDSA
jgi:hypothetical protein